MIVKTHTVNLQRLVLQEELLQTGTDGSIDAQKYKLDNYEILDPTNLTMTMKTLTWRC